jgi:hypothetical protein
MGVLRDYIWQAECEHVESNAAADRAYFWLPVTETRVCWPRGPPARPPVCLSVLS